MHWGGGGGGGGQKSQTPYKIENWGGGLIQHLSYAFLSSSFAYIYIKCRDQLSLVLTAKGIVTHYKGAYVISAKNSYRCETCPFD